MKKMKTKAELKSVGDFLKTGAPATGGGGGGQDLNMLPLPLTCGLCYKVTGDIPQTFITVLTPSILC